MDKTIFNPKFLEACQKRLDEKSSEYDGEDNSKNYRNMCYWDLTQEIANDVCYIQSEFPFFPSMGCSKEKIQKLCIDIASRCSMIWEKLEAK